MFWTWWKTSRKSSNLIPTFKLFSPIYTQFFNNTRTRSIYNQKNKSFTIRCRKVDTWQLSNVNFQRSLKVFHLLNLSDKKHEIPRIQKNTMDFMRILSLGNIFLKKNIKYYELIQEQLFQHFQRYLSVVESLRNKCFL